MSQAQVVSRNDTTHSLDVESDVERVLDNWKKWRSTLADTVQGYLAACTDLVAICTSPSHRQYGRQKIEKALLSVDEEMTGLASEEATLHKALISLKFARNLSTTLAPIHTLPPEILANIFLVMQKSSGYCHQPNKLPPVQALAETSSYWRQVAINTPSLWADIKISTAGSCYDNAALSLSRANGLPIHLSVSELSPNKGDVYRSWDESPKLPAFLTQACQRIHKLDINSSVIATSGIHIVMKHWLDHCSVGVTKSLKIKKDDSAQSRSALPLGWSFNLASIEHAEAVLESLSVLQLEAIFIPWTSAAYHNLIDLRLYFNWYHRVQISASQLANILSSSPGLTTLKLEGLEITRSDSFDAVTLVSLVHLEVLYLGSLSHESLERLLSLVSLSNCLNALDVALDAPEATDTLRPLFHNIRTRSLVCSNLDFGIGPQWALSLSSVVISLDSLVLQGFAHLSEAELQTTTLGHQTGGDGVEPHEQDAPRLPHLCMETCDVNLEGLKTIVSAYGVENLHLNMCRIGNPEGGGHMGLEELRNELLHAFPDLVCDIPGHSTAYEWPCRDRFTSWD
ncbi:hypothetical protein FRC12_020737 [Ceratobasidium sp. 428]|nr:hypothetical protein FRC09_012612 [Ceratobasidium sp. 395]KAG8782514.1 hypothetical protein FRC12_020737 [Ceratobasidium sp. 428]